MSMMEDTKTRMKRGIDKTALFTIRLNLWNIDVDIEYMEYWIWNIQYMENWISNIEYMNIWNFEVRCIFIAHLSDQPNIFLGEHIY